MWHDDAEQIVAFPRGVTTHDVVERMIAILQAGIRPERR
jgi:hypothetical protein